MTDKKQTNSTSSKKEPERKAKPLPYRVQSLTLHLEEGTIAGLARPSQKDIDKTVYYLPGRDGKIATGLGEGILSLGYGLEGRETPGSFKNLSFQEQLDLIANDLQSNFWNESSKVVAVSYGCYLLMHTLSELEVYPGSILLLSPVLGGVINKGTLRYYSPARPDKLMQLVETKSFPVPKHIEIHVGDSDWQCPSERVIQFADSVNGNCAVVSNTGHDLGKAYVTPVLAQWLSAQG